MHSRFRARQGQWDQVAFIYDHTTQTQTVVVNGEKHSHGGHAPYKGGESIQIGKGFGNGWPGAWNGEIKNAMIFSHALNPNSLNSEINAVSSKSSVNVSADPGSETVSISFFADDWIDEVYYNGVSIRNQVQNVNTICCHNCAPCSTTINLVPGGVLVIAAHDNEPGTSASFSFRARSSNPKSPWNFELSPQNAGKYVKAFACPGKNGAHKNALSRPEDKNPGHGWTSNEYNDDHWGTPGQATHHHWHTHHGMNAVWYNRQKFQFYRFTGPALRNYGGDQKQAASRGMQQQTSASSGLTAELRELIAMKKEGMLTDEEFSAAKRQLLGLDAPSPSADDIAPPGYDSPEGSGTR